MAMCWGSAGDDQFYGRIDGSGRLSFDFVSRFSSDDVSIRICFRAVDLEDVPESGGSAFLVAPHIGGRRFLRQAH